MVGERGISKSIYLCFLVVVIVDRPGVVLVWVYGSTNLGFENHPCYIISWYMLQIQNIYCMHPCIVSKSVAVICWCNDVVCHWTTEMKQLDKACLHTSGQSCLSNIDDLYCGPDSII